MSTTADALGGAPTPETAQDQGADLARLYEDFRTAGLTPLWTQRADLQPVMPQPDGRPARWAWSTLYPLAERAGHLVQVGRGGERRAIALANPGIGGEPYTTATLWTAIQYLGPHETAPAHRHSQSAFRFVVEGDGVWTNVEGDAVAMRRGDLLLTPGWHFHEHHNITDHPMAWIDGLDIPLVSRLDAGFFEYGPPALARTDTPDTSWGERLWGHPGVRPLADPARASSPLLAYRWEHTDAALADQLACAEEGASVLVEEGHAAVRFVNPLTGRDALRTIRTEMHRIDAGRATATVRNAGSAVWQVFQGSGRATVDGHAFELAHGDIFAVPSWAPLTVAATSQLDLFRFSDEPVLEALGLARTERSPHR